MMRPGFPRFLSATFFSLIILSSPVIAARGNLENPAKDSVQSGIGIISGWHCDADVIEILIDGRPPKEASYGTSRKDTERVCGDIDNGFGLLFSWSHLDVGKHRIQAFADGVKFADRMFTVGRIEPGSFIRGVSAEYVLNEFPDRSTEVVIVWNENLQNFTVKESRENSYDDIDQHWEGFWSPHNDNNVNLDRALIYRFQELSHPMIYAHFLRRRDLQYIAFKGELKPESDSVVLETEGGLHKIKLTRVSLSEILVESQGCLPVPPDANNKVYYDCWLDDDLPLHIYLHN